jgi:DNA-binding NarL/FixJ family response regulator
MAGSARIRVLLVDDHALFRQGLAIRAARTGSWGGADCRKPSQAPALADVI